MQGSKGVEEVEKTKQEMEFLFGDGRLDSSGVKNRCGEPEGGQREMEGREFSAAAI